MTQSDLVQMCGAEFGGDMPVLFVHDPARPGQHASIETGAAVAEQLLLQTSLEYVVGGLGDREWGRVAPLRLAARDLGFSTKFLVILINF